MSKNVNRESVFRFKQFQVRNKLSAMKVGTDGVLIGAWADVSNVNSVLDIGCGTGLISLMTAQRCNATIIGVEIDRNAAEEAKTNFENSPWVQQLFVRNIDFADMCDTDECYDLIISNPPFFSNGITAPDKSRATARHGLSLTYEHIIAFASTHLTASGRLVLISPYDSLDSIICKASYHRLNISRQTDVYSTPGKSQPIRILWEMSCQQQQFKHTKLHIRNSDNSYSSEYIDLTKEFYLNF